MVDRTATGATAFRTVFEVGSSFTGRAREIAAAFQDAISPTAADAGFDAISRAASGIPDGSTVKFVRGWGLQETAPVSVMVLSLREAVRQALPLPFANPLFWEKTERALTEVFVGLDRREGSGPSLREEGPGSTRYHDNLLFVLQDEETEGFLYAVACRVDVTVALDGEKVLSLTAEDTAQYAIRLDAVTVRQALPSGD